MTREQVVALAGTIAVLAVVGLVLWAGWGVVPPPVGLGGLAFNGTPVTWSGWSLANLIATVGL